MKEAKPPMTINAITNGMVVFHDRMSHIEIAGIAGKRTDNVLRTLTTLAEAGAIASPQIEGRPRIDKKGRIIGNDQHHLLNRLDSITLMASINPLFCARLVHRWDELEQENYRLREEVKELKEAREETKALHKPVMLALTGVRLDEGKITQGHHFSNEANMMNTIVLGMTAKKYRELHNIPSDEAIRDYFTKEELAKMSFVESMDENLLLMGMADYQQRKAAIIKALAKKFEG